MTTTSTSTDSSPFSLDLEFFECFNGDAERLYAQNLYETFNARKCGDEELPVTLEPELMLLYSILALMEFYRQNWLGPRKPLLQHGQFSRVIAQYTQGKSLNSLIIDGEYPYRLTKQPELLIFALERLGSLRTSAPESKRVVWWHLRALYLHQRLVDCGSPTLRSKIIATLKNGKDLVCTAQEALEAANLCQECEDEKLAQFYLDESARLAKMSFAFIGKLGRRTIHQTFDVYQLTVQVSHQNDTSANDSAYPCSKAPQNISLNDDLLRETVEFTDGADSPAIAAHLDLAILLANARQLWRFHARDSEITEKLEALNHKILEAPNSWQIYSAGLFWRSKIESERGRTMERACLQFKALAEQVDYCEDSAVVDSSRFNWSFCVYFPSEWECDREQGLLFASLGAFKTALDIFERREMFEEAVQCLINLGRIDDAQNVVLQQLERFPEDAKLICVHGDVKKVVWEGSQAPQQSQANSPEFKDVEETYLRAWSVSGNRLAKAQRSLGSLYYMVGDYKKVRSALAKAVAINPLFESSWFLLGFASIQLEDYAGALRSFTRLITLNQDNPEAWKHIANCQVKLGKLDEAHRALAQVTRLQFDISDGWLSLFSVSLTIGEPMDAIRSLRRYIEILVSSSSENSSTSFSSQETAKIIEMIAQICDLVIRVCILEEERIKTDLNYREMTLPVKRQFDQFLLEFVAQTSLASVSEFWLQVARYLKSDRWPIHAPQVKEALLKAYRCLQSRPYDKDPATFNIITQIITSLKEVDASLQQQPSSDVEMMLRSVKKRCKEAFQGTEQYESL